MLQSIDERLMEARTRKRESQKLEAMLREARHILGNKEIQCSELKERVDSEKSDVDKLQGLSLSGLFYSIIGTKVEKIAKEKEEYISAKIKYEESTREIEEMRGEVDSLQIQLDQCSEADAEYGRLIREKESLLLGDDGNRAKQLLELSESQVDLISDRKELREAINAGDTAIASLEKAWFSLRSAQDWGLWDELRSAMDAGMGKITKIDTAQQQVLSAQLKIMKFQEELADADRRFHITLEIGGFVKFADLFYDGLIFDFTVHQKIIKSSIACHKAIMGVKTAVKKCRVKLEETEKEIKRIRGKREAFIEGTTGDGPGEVTE